ncbi:MAG: hypothetical protein V3V78_04725 [Candidatus Woesearchaeota archaeon]
MKLTVLKGIGNNLAKYLDSEIWFGYFKDIPSKIDTNVLEQKDGLSKTCVAFFKEKLPKSFDFNRIKEINLKITKTSTSLKIAIKIKVDDKEITSYGMSTMS